MILCAAVLATLLVIGGVELNPGPVDSIVQVLCSGCDSWYHNSCGNVEFQVAESGNCTDAVPFSNCDRCRSERLRVLEEKLTDAQIQIEELKRRIKALEKQILLTEKENDVGKGTL
jgi:TolA-binding protein